MVKIRKHEDLMDLTGVYALDAVEDDERDIMELHLRECPRCRAEVETFRETAALMAHGGVDAPAGMWDRIVEQLDEAPPAVAPIFSMRPAAVTPRRRWMTGAMAAAAAVLVAIPAAAIVVRQNDRINEINQGVAQQANLERVALAASADPLARKARLRSVDGQQTASAVVLPDGRGYLIRHDLAPLEAGRVYQLWGMPEGTAKPISLGVLGSSPRVAAFSADTPFTGLAISVERAGGAVAPTGRPVLVGELVGRT